MRKGFAAAIVAAALLLTGCVGIPTSGGVQAGPVIDEEVNPEFVALPSDPRPGSTQEEILADFMQAVRGPQGDYAVAKKFLTASLSETWNPDANALIRTGVPITSSPGENQIDYTVTGKASVNEQGNFSQEREPATQTLNFGFELEGGEWRISQAADGIVLSQSSFNVAFREQALYFFDPSFAYLVPDVRWFPARQTSSVRLVNALLAGPSPWLQQAVQTAFPPATALGDDRVRSQAGSVIVDLSPEAAAATPQDRDRMRQQLVATLDSPNTELTVRGLELQTPDQVEDRAVINPSVDAPVLVGTPTAFGFDGGNGISSIAGMSDSVVATGAAGGTLSSDNQTFVFVGNDGGVYEATVGDEQASALRPGPGYAVPSIDPFDYVWTAQSGSAASLTTVDLAGNEHVVQSGLPADASVVSLDVSRDGTRLLVYLSTPVGPQLAVYGIIRQSNLGNVPVRLGEPLELPVSTGAAVDATWVDDRTVAVISATGDITALEIGGPTAIVGQLIGARAIVGGNNGTDGLRVLGADGLVYRPQGSGSWVNTGIEASFLGTKQ